MRKLLTLIILLVFVALTPTALAETPDITAQPGQVDPYKTRSELLMDAAKYTGVVSPDRAAALWARGLMARSAAMQYAVMTNALKQEYAAQLDALNSNWVTGMSSPWVAGFSVTKVKRLENARAEVGLRLKTMTSAGPPEYHNAKLWLVREDGFCRIERIETDEELYPYTLYTPK